MKKSQLRNIIKEVIRGNPQLLNEQVQGAAVCAIICNPGPNDCTQTICDTNFITICDGPGYTNCTTPVVGDYMVSTSVKPNCQMGVSYNTSWEVTYISGYDTPNGMRMRYHQCDYVGWQPPSFDCIPGQGCIDPGTGQGQYANLSGWNGCQANCIEPSFNCKVDKHGNTSCINPGDGTGQYSTLQDCQAICTMHQVGVGHTLGSEPKSFDCKIDKFGNTSCTDPGNGNGQYSTLQDCQANCVIATANDDDDDMGFVDDPPNPNACNATMTLSNYNPAAYSGTITINFSGPTKYAFNLKGPNPTGIINTIMSSGPIMGPTVNTTGPVNVGTYTLDYECDLNNLSNITLPNQVTLDVP